MVFKWVLKNCDFITANNENQIEIMGSLGVSDAKLKAVPNGFDLNSFKPRNKVKTRAKLGLAQDKKIILFVGWLIERKGLNYLLDSMSQIKNQNALLLVIGEGLLELKLKEYTKKLGISDQVKFLGSKHPDELPYWMNASDILVLPSLSEGRPNVVGEAMASGLPVIASNVNGTPEFIEDGQNGFLVPAKDSKAITEKLLKLLDSEEMRFDIGKKAHESIIEKKLTWENCASNYRNIYNKIL